MYVKSKVRPKNHKIFFSFVNASFDDVFISLAKLKGSSSQTIFLIKKKKNCLCNLLLLDKRARY